jgi:hypothetical protein
LNRPFVELDGFADLFRLVGTDRLCGYRTTGLHRRIRRHINLQTNKYKQDQLTR